MNYSNECQLIQDCLQKFLLLKFYCCTIIHRIVQMYTKCIRYNYQQIIKRESLLKSCWLDLSTTSPQKGIYSRVQRVNRIAIVKSDSREDYTLTLVDDFSRVFTPCFPATFPIRTPCRRCSRFCTAGALPVIVPKHNIQDRFQVD